MDFAPFVTAAKAESPDAIVADSLAGPAGKILDEVAKQMPGKRVIGGNGLNSSALLSNANAALMVVGTAWSKASTDKTNTDFIAAYKQKFGNDPDQFAAQSYTAMLVLIDAMKRTSRMSDKAQVKQQLEAVKELATPLGAFSFTSENSLPSAPVEWMPMARMPASGPMPNGQTKMKASTTCGTERITSKTRRVSQRMDLWRRQKADSQLLIVH